MGRLKPGATYIYERTNGVVYQRELGSDPETRTEVGWDYDPRTDDGRPLVEHIRDKQLWGDIIKESKKNPLLQEALDRAKIIYELSKTDGKE